MLETVVLDTFMRAFLSIHLVAEELDSQLLCGIVVHAPSLLEEFSWHPHVLAMPVGGPSWLTDFV